MALRVEDRTFNGEVRIIRVEPQKFIIAKGSSGAWQDDLYLLDPDKGWFHHSNMNGCGKTTFETEEAAQEAYAKSRYKDRNCN